MPASRFLSASGRASVFVVAMLVFSGTATAAAAASSGDDPPTHSKLDAPLFYQLLLGEIELRDGDAATAYKVLLDAAERAKDEALFRHVTDIALRARAGEQALGAVRAWRKAIPGSQQAIRYQLQLLVALNRVGEIQEPLTALLDLTPKPSLPKMIDAVPRFLARSTDHAAVADVIERTMKPFAANPETRTSALVATGRGWLAAGDSAKALDFAQRASAADPQADGPALLALDLLPAVPAAEAIVTTRLARTPANPAVRMLYVRTLASEQRIADAVGQTTTLVESDPGLAPPWLTLGALQLDARHPREAITALETYVRLVQGGASVTFAPAPAASAPPTGNEAASDDGDDDTPSNQSNALTQAWLLLSQAAEQQGDLPGAERWLAHIDNSQRALDVQSRRASLLAKQGKMQEARELIRRVPEHSDTDARAKLLAEANLLREAKQWSDAETVLAQANKLFPDDVDLLYEEAMIDEKLDRLDDMERLL
ncbi:MAG TPA: hypothetical protein VFF72_11780, partial [Caldimonas sp.]|nr:hypothetical protein [Caldimonas sp.]